MGAVQVLRLALAIQLVAIAAAAANPAPPATATAPAPVVRAPAPIDLAIVELRTDVPDAERARLLVALAGAGLAPIGGALGAALAGHEPDDTAATAALAEAQDAYGDLDCGRARPAAERAVQLLAARTAAGLAEAPRLERAWTYIVLCAERDGDRSSARFGVERLRALGAGPGAVPAELWARYPEVDAAPDRDIVELTVTGPAGAVAWVDDRAIGPVPARTFVHAGRHLVAVAAGAARGATFATAMGQPLTVDVEAVAAPAGAGGLAEVAAAVRGHQAAGTIDATALAALLATAGVALAIVLERDGTATLWQLQDGVPAVVASGTEVAVAAAARQVATDEVDRAPDPDVALLREDDVPDDRADQGKTRWWVYAAIGGAIVAGAVVIYAADAGDDRQRFELRF